MQQQQAHAGCNSLPPHPNSQLGPSTCCDTVQGGVCLEAEGASQEDTCCQQQGAQELSDIKL
jgi:hypothetical protein